MNTISARLVTWRRNRSVHNQIMWRIVPVLVVVFALIAVVGIAALQSNIRARLEQTHTEQVNARIAGITETLQRYARDAELTAASAPAEDLARLARQFGAEAADTERTQTELNRAFLELLSPNSGLYSEVRFITARGEVWTRVWQQNNILISNNNRMPGALTDDPLAQRVMQDGNVLLSPITLTTDVTGAASVVVRIIAPVFGRLLDDGAQGLIDLRAQAEPMLREFNRLEDEDQRWVLINNQGRYLADSTAARLQSRLLGDNTYSLVADAEPALADLLASVSGNVTLANSNAGLITMRTFPVTGLTDAPWTLVFVDASATTLDILSRAIINPIILSLLAFLVTTVLISLVIRRRLEPLKMARAMAFRLAEGHIEDTLPPPTPNDELGQLVDLVKRISVRLYDLTTQAETELEQQLNHLERGAQISRRATRKADAHDSLGQIVINLCEEFRLYHAQLYLTDEVGLNALIIFSHGPFGRRLLAEQRKVRLGSPTPVGAVAATGETVIIADTRDRDQVSYQLDPLLTNSRSLLALPLIVGEHVIGVLELHSDRPRAFGQDEVRIFQMLADQMAITIARTREVLRATGQLERSEALNRQLTQAAWQETELRLGLQEAYEYNLMDVQPTADLRDTIEAISAPIVVRGEVIGTIAASSQEGVPFAEGDVTTLRAIADRVGLAIEGARLFKETQTNLGITSSLYELSRQLNEANHIDEVLGAVIQSVAPESVNGQIWLFDEYPGDHPEWMELASTWSADAFTRRRMALKTRVHVSQSPYLSALEPGHITVVNDVAEIAGSDPELGMTLGAQSGQPVILVPFSARGRWRGLLTFVFATARPIGDSEQRVYAALMDPVGVAVDNRLLFDETQTQARRALALAEVGQLVTRLGADFERNINEVFRRVADPASYDRWIVTLINDLQPDHLQPVTLHGPAEFEAISPDLDLASSQHSIAEAVRIGHLLLVNDPARFPGFTDQTATYQTAIGKHIVTPLWSGTRISGALLVGRGLDQADLDERDEQLVRTLAAQVSVAIENRRLFRAAETEREYLRSILESMPVGVIVIDGRTFRPIQANAQAETLLGRSVDQSVPFSSDSYHLMRTGTDLFYPADELPVYIAASTGGQAASDDIAAIRQNGEQVDLLINAAPIHDSRGQVSAIVTAVQDISNLRGLETALQDNLREQIALYEATRALSEADDLDAALDAAIGQLFTLEPADGYLILRDERTGALQPVRGLASVEQFNLPDDIFLPSTQLIPNVAQDAILDDATRDHLLGAGVRAAVTVPLRTRDALLGWIAVTYDQPVQFTSDNERFLSTLADNAAVAIDNRNLYRRTEEAFQEATVLYETGRDLANARSADDVVRIGATRIAMPSVGQTFLAFALRNNPQANALQVVAHWQDETGAGVSLAGLTLDEEQFPPYRMLASPDLLTISDVQTEEGLSESERLALDTLNTRSIAVLPLKSAGRRTGAIWFGSPRPYIFNDRDLRIFRSFAEQAGLALEASHLLEQTERRARQLGTSAQVSQIASAILDINELLPRVVDLIRDSFGYDHVQIFLMNAADTFAELRASTGEAGRQLLSINHRLARGSQSVIGQVTATGRPVIALDTADARVVHRPNPYLALTRSEMALPIIVKGRVVGALDVQSNAPNAFSEEDTSVLTTLAAQLAVALDNARLFEQAENRARDMSFLFNATTAAARPDRTLTDSLQGVAELVQESLGALTTTIYLSDSYNDHAGNVHTLLRPTALAGSDQPFSEIAEIYLDGEPGFLATLAREPGEGVVIDVEQAANYIPIAAEAQTIVALPMSAANEVIGVIVLEDAETNAYTQDTVNLLGALTNSLSAIVQSARLLDQVQRTNEQLRELDRVKSDFLANMSHELRTPLNSIIGFSRVILKGIDGPLTEMQEQDLTTIYNGGTHLLGLINDLLDQAKITAGKMELHPDYFELKPVVEGVRSIGIGLIKDKPVEIKLEIESGLPKAFGDELRTRQVLLNLVSNAAKFTRQGSIVIRSYLEWQPDASRNMIRVDVQDSGIGIADKDLPLLFEAFRQVDSSLTRTVGGTGLGLPIAKSLVEMQGGTMMVHSEVNVGSTFSILIPLEPPPPPEADQPDQAFAARPIAHNQTIELSRSQLAAMTPTAEQQEMAREVQERHLVETNGASDAHPLSLMPASASSPAHLQILLIEDSPDMVDQFRRALQREGFDIFAASIPLEAEAMASGLRPTLIIMNAEFANGAAWGILERLHHRDDTHDIPVILVSLMDESARAAEAGAFAFLQRPFVPDQLVQLVRAAEEDSRTERILIIDDQPDSTRLFRQILDQAGHFRVFSASSGPEGISLVARRRPDLVILDLRMPEMDGFAVLTELRANPETARIPILLVTADTLNSDEQSRLADLQVLYKADLNHDNYQDFIEGVRAYLVRERSVKG